MKALRAVGGITFLWAWLPAGLDAQQIDIELGLIGGWGIEEPYHGSIGASAGVLVRRFYGGGRVVKHFGTTITRTGTIETTTTEQSAWVLGGEFGYPILLEPVDLRLSATVGAFRFKEIVRQEPIGGGTPTETTRTKTTSMFSPAVTALIPLPGFKIGAEVVLLNGGDPNFSETYGTRSVAFYGRVIVPIGT